ncbi:cation:proton antiporter [Campylobacter sp. MG1]|uniref:cation:proton antiporter n=1 Tax=Campylobacter sp. MG1 TaxID=2976332 RepID=UPI00226D25E3|nr:cation:proton antiporter [Campylobacter sp. MG1]
MELGSSDLRILLFISFVVFSSPYIAKTTRLPILAVEIILGAIAGAFHIITKTQAFELASHIGFCYLMFIAGLEVSLRDFTKLKKQELKQIFIFYVILYFLSTMLALSLNLNLIIAIIIPAMSVGLISILFKEFDKTPKWLNFTMVYAALGELITIILVTLVNSFSSSNNLNEVLISVFSIIFFLFAFMIIYYICNAIFWWLPWLKEILMPDYDKAEKNVRLSLALWMLAVALMLYFGFEIALGAFLAGMFISSFFGHKKDLEHKLSSLGQPFLIPIFFVYVGLSIDFSLINLKLLLLALGIVFFMALFRIISSFVFYKEYKFQCILIALSSCMPLTLLIAIATLGQRLNLIDNVLYLALVLASLLEALIFMWLIPKISLLFETPNKKIN